MSEKLNETNKKLFAEEHLVEIDNVKKWYKSNSSGIFGKTITKAVDGVTFGINEGETFGLVGESGCGKSTLAQIVLRLEEATCGSVRWEGKDIYKMNSRQMQKLRRDMQIIFQDPYDSLNPRMTLGEIIAEPLNIHKYGSSREKREKVGELLDIVGLPGGYIKRYSHQLSGGQRQRVSIARAIALSPRFLICDEAVSALDVSIQAQILNLFLSLKEDLGLSYLFITHDLSVVEFMSDRIGVMYYGNLVEIGHKSDIFKNSMHPYTQALISAIPSSVPNAKKKRRVYNDIISSPDDSSTGCIFHQRCPFRKEICLIKKPKMIDVESGHKVACHLVNEL